MYRVAEQKGRGFIILRKSDRKKMNKGYFLTSKVAKEEMNNLITEDAQKAKSEHLFVDAFKAWIDERKETADNPDLALTRGAIEPYYNDYNLRIKPFMENVLLSDFDYTQMIKFLKRCYQAGHRYKRLKRTVRNIKTFLNKMALYNRHPNLSCLKFDISKDAESIFPDAHVERAQRETAIIDETALGDMMAKLNANKDKDFKSALTYAVFGTMFTFGFRRSEIKGLKPQHIDLTDGRISIKGVFLSSEGGYKRRTKNEGSYRQLNLDDKVIDFFDWWLSVLKKHRPHTTWLFPATRDSSGPISDKGLSNLLWSTYADNGLATIEWKNGHVVVIDSPLKFAPMRTFRHRLATLLIDNMDTANLGRNFIKQLIGHQKFTTTQDIYGNHNRKITAAQTTAVSNILKINQNL